MSVTAQRVLHDLTALDPDELQRVRDEASRLLDRQSHSPPVERPDAAELPPGRLIRPTPPEGHPGGSLERADPFFAILERLEEEQHRRAPRAPVCLEV